MMFLNSEQEEERMEKQLVDAAFFPCAAAIICTAFCFETDFNYSQSLNGLREKVGKKIFHSHFRKMQRSLPRQRTAMP